MNDFELKEIMEYNSETGLFTWLKRSESVHEKYMAIDSNQSVSHATKLWNSKHAGKNIGSNSNGYREVRIKTSYIDYIALLGFTVMVTCQCKLIISME